MDFTFLHRPQPKKFEYKPRFYKPEAEPDETGRTPDQTEQFARRLHREWESKRTTRKEKKGFSKMTIFWLVVIIGVLLYFLLK